MMVTTRFRSSTAAVLCVLLLQNCQSHTLRATEGKEPAVDDSSASVMRQHTSSEPPAAMQTLIPPSASPAAHVSSSRLATTLANEEAPSAARLSRSLSLVARNILTTVSDSLKILCNLPAVTMPKASHAVPLGEEPGHTPSPDGPVVCMGRVEGVLREMPSDEEEDSNPLSKRQSSTLAPEDDRANKRARAGERAEPDEATELLNALLVVTQVDRCRQPVLETLTSPNMLYSLRSIAQIRDKIIHFRALKILGEVEWKYYFGDIGPAPELPSNMGTILDSECPFWKGKKVRDTHLLVLIPARVNGQPFSLNLLCELIRHPRNGGHKTKYVRYNNSLLQAQIGSTPPDRSYWLLMTRSVLPKSRSKTYAAQEKLVADRARRVSLPYEMPKALEAATAILTHHVRNGERLYSDSPWTYTHCQEWILHQSGEYPAVVGGFGSSGLRIRYDDYDHDDYGVAGCLKLNRCARQDVLNILLEMASSQPDKAIQFLDVLLVAAQNNDCRQRALKALGKVAEASPNMFSECLPSLRAVAKTGDKAVRLLALKTLGEMEWKHYFGDVGPAPDLPSDMPAILDSTCPFWPEKKVRDTHLLALIPATVDKKPFTLSLLKELIESPKNGGHRTKYFYYDSNVKGQIGADSPAASYWLLMTRDVLPESRNKRYAEQKKLVTAHARRTDLPYELPKVLEAATVILTHHVRDGEQLYNGENPRNFTRCQEWILHQSNGYPIVVGGFESSGLNVSSHDYDNDDVGVAGVRKFF